MVECVCLCVSTRGHLLLERSGLDPLKMEADWRADALQDELIKLKSQCETRGRLSLSSIALRGQIQFHLSSLFYSRFSLNHSSLVAEEWCTAGLNLGLLLILTLSRGNWKGTTIGDGCNMLNVLCVIITHRESEFYKCC